MTNVKLQNMVKTFSRVTALNDVSFDVRDGEFFVLLGPTGAGKTTTLRVIAGLEDLDSGDIFFDGESIAGYTPADRDVAFVFQQYSLYPTMTVYDNLAFPLKAPVRKFSKQEIYQRVTDVAEMLRISHLLDRKTAKLSGGEMQRVSIGRAIVRQPRIFLMDEPLSNLDAKLREALRVELQHLQKTQNSTTLFVTHDQIEALTMADRIGVLNLGELVQVGSPEDIYDRPATTFVAQLVGTPRINLVSATRSNGRLQVKDSDLDLAVPPLDLPQEFLLGVRPEDVKIAPAAKFTGEIVLSEPLGVETILHIRTGEMTILSLIPGITDARIGDQVRFDFARERLHFFDEEGKRIQ
ncbi:MAG: ABC transporter ATP-binding protein [Chloroflexota bacterium]|nr:ABC transporter ATP-binding protein [Chloroflexota bacterium]